jgi:hypothetical protein
LVIEIGAIMLSGIVAIDEIRSASLAAGSNWFTPGAMRFFRTRLPRTGRRDSAGKIWFVSSEAMRYGPRRYSVRVFCPQTGQVNTHGDFRSYATAAAARRAMAAAIV